MSTRRLLQNLFGSLFLLGIVLPSAAQLSAPDSVGLSESRLDRIGELIDRHIDAGQISGAVTLVARHGQIAHLEAQGLMDIESNTPMRRDAIFRIASMSKPVAGVAIMMLIEDGKIRLRDPVSKYIPSFADPQVVVARTPNVADRAGTTSEMPETVPAERAITVFDLLTHTSGVMSGPLSNPLGSQLSAQRHDLGLTWVDELGAVPLEFQPGERWAYSALAGFDVLSRIVEIASGQDFYTFVRENIFQPLDMGDTSFWPRGRQRERVANSYIPRDGALVPRPNPDSMSGEIYFSGAGGLMTTAQDYAQFAMMLANGGAHNGVQIISPRAVEFLGSVHIPDTLSGRPSGEGFGLSVRVVSDPVARGTLLDSGAFGWSGFYGTHFFVDPSNNMTAVMMTQTSVPGMRDDFETAVMQALMD